jgi:hypothetical protein
MDKSVGSTLVVMVAIWGRSVAMFFDPASDFENFGIPLILYSPKASFIGWLALMMLISPLLQVLTTSSLIYNSDILNWAQEVRRAPRLRM